MFLHIFNFGLFFIPAFYFSFTVVFLFFTYPIFIIRSFIIIAIILLFLLFLIEMRNFSKLLLILVSLLLALLFVSVLLDLFREV
jgi:hypothetical protein